jgi:predicted ATPase/DNA-binding winged helix-turn-helix (wHTH) protein
VETIAWSFDKFTLLADRRLLMAEGLPVRLGGRALDVLIALVEYAGQFVSRDELISRIWGTRVVEEINLRVQVATLRRLLGDDGRGDPQFILNVPTKGYCFVAPVTRIGKARVIAPVQRTTADLPTPLATLVGRDATVWKLVDELRSSRIVTIVGAGGVGKSAVAVKVAGVAAHRHPDGVVHVDLSGLADVHVASDRIAAALGSSGEVPRVAEWIVGALRERQMLLLLDGCEGVIDLVALLAEEIQGKASRATLLATSREPLRIPGEQVHRLGPLDVPPPDAIDAPDMALSFSAVQLFLERTCTGSGDFDPSAADILLMSELCRRLDGIPLAIELAAHCMAHIGLAGILEQLDDGFDVLVDERRVDAPHHQSLRASFDWSFANLIPQEQRILCRLSVFAGAFSLASGAHLASAEGSEEDGTARELIGQLATKSLVSVESGPGGVQYRLLGATRACARARLRAHADDSCMRLRHAKWVIGMLATLDELQVTQGTPTDLSRAASAIDDVRVALDWLSKQGDSEALRIGLLAASVQCWFRLSALVEYCDRAEQALDSAWALAVNHDRVRVMAALGHARLHAFGPDAQALATSEQAVVMAGQLGQRDARLVACWGLWFGRCLSGQHADALQLAQMHDAIAAPETPATSIAVVTDKHETLIVSTGVKLCVTSDVMLLVSLTNVARHAEARACGERALAGTLLMPIDGACAGSQLENEAVGKASLARLLWIQGLPERSLAMASDAVDVARKASDDLALCFCLHELCVIALWTGELASATDAATALSDLATKHQLGYWEAWARFDRAAIAFTGERRMRPDWRDSICGAPQLELMTTLSTDLPEPEVLLRADAGQAPWCEPEILRARGCQAALLETEQGRQKALGLFERALQLARDQGALAWELRAATSIASVSNQPREASMAIELLTNTLSRFTEGFDTPDLVHAQESLQKLNSK